MNLLKVFLPLLLVGCGGSVGSNDKSNNDKSQNESWEYDYTYNDCSTGKVTGSGKASYFAALKDDSRNKFCAETLRKQAFEKECGPWDNEDPSNNNRNNNNNSNNSNNNSEKKYCGYSFTNHTDPLPVKATLQGTWVTRSRGVSTEPNDLGDRTYKNG